MNCKSMSGFGRVSDFYMPPDIFPGNLHGNGNFIQTGGDPGGQVPFLHFIRDVPFIGCTTGGLPSEGLLPHITSIPHAGTIRLLLFTKTDIQKLLEHQKGKELLRKKEGESGGDEHEQINK